MFSAKFGGMAYCFMTNTNSQKQFMDENTRVGAVGQCDPNTYEKVINPKSQIPMKKSSAPLSSNLGGVDRFAPKALSRIAEVDASFGYRSCSLAGRPNPARVRLPSTGESSSSPIPYL